VRIESGRAKSEIVERASVEIVEVSTHPSFFRSTATRNAAWPVRLPFLVCSMNSRLFMTVNSQSCMSW